MAKEYIDRDAVLALAKDICVLTKWDSEYRHRSIDPIDVRELPAADVVPVRHGKWEKKQYAINWSCSLCGNEPFHCHLEHMNYCPNCGARMDGDGDV